LYTIQVGYPKLYRERDKDDKLPGEPYSASEALKIARSVESLKDLTLDPNMQRNEFVRIWDKQVNGVDNGAPELSLVQKFDLEVILALVQFGETVVLAAASVADAPANLPFFPLLVEYREKFYAAGKIPGGFLKREARPHDEEILAGRLIDRTIRPLFPEASRTRCRSSSTCCRPTRRTTPTCWGS
jgi:hypothetical protein